MSGKEPRPEPLIDQVEATPWEQARERLEQAATFWLATTRPDGSPHVRPLMAAWLDGAMYFASSERAKKSKNLVHQEHATLVTCSPEQPPLDLVVEGKAAKVSDEALLRRVAEAYADQYGWQVEVRDGAFWGDGAPTAGPPPYAVFVLIPTKAYGFPGMGNAVDDARSEQGMFTPTRWRF